MLAIERSAAKERARLARVVFRSACAQGVGGSGVAGEVLDEEEEAGRSSRTKLALEIWAIGDELEEEWRTSSGWQFSGN